MNSIIRYLINTVNNFPENIAVSDENTEYTWSEVLEEAKAVGSMVLVKSGGKRALPVAVFLSKCSQCVPAFMGILWAGCVYAPINYTEPIERILATLKQLKPVFILTDESGAEKLSELEICKTVLYSDIKSRIDGKINNEGLSISLNDTIDKDPAYIIHTSGSTGVPKGVAISHGGVIDFAECIVDTFKIDEKTIIGLQTAFHFDASVLDMYACIFTGARLVVIPDAMFLYPTKVPGYVEEKHINFICWVPTVMTSIANSGILKKGIMPQLKTVTFVGELMPTKTYNLWKQNMPECIYANLYGPTETTCASTCYIIDREFSDSEPLPVGFAFKNTRIILLTEDDKYAEFNQHGEICIIGTGLSIGYWNDEIGTKLKFTSNPANENFHERIYRTGDLGYFCESGNLMFVGRSDSQIKLRGNRIELGDVETAALGIEGVRNAACIFDFEESCIVLFVESKDEFVLRKFNMELAKHIPKYMLPGKLFTLDEFPLTINRKIDRRALQEFYMNKKEIKVERNDE